MFLTAPPGTGGAGLRIAAVSWRNFGPMGDSLHRLAGYRTVRVPAMPFLAWPGTGHRYW